MAVNPTLAADGSHDNELFPLPKPNENFCLKRNGIDFECILTASNHQLYGSGVFFLTTKRIVFVAKSKSCRPDFKSFEVSLSSLWQPKFEQPIFGANYLGGIAGPVTDGFTADPASAPLQGRPAKFKLTFNHGGCQTFLDTFFKLMDGISKDDNRMSQAIEQGRINSVAYVDPQDPSVLYVAQPRPTPGSEQVQAFEVEEASAPPAEAQPAFADNEHAEVVILDGRHSGNYVACRVLSRNPEGKYKIFIEETEQYNRVGGFAGKEVDGIEPEHLRKPGTVGAFSTSGGGKGCVIC